MQLNRIAASSHTEDTDMPDQASAEATVSVQQILASFIKFASHAGMLPGMQKRGLKRAVMIALAVFANACIYAETVCIAAMFLRTPFTLNTNTTLLIVAVFFHLYCASINTIFLWLSCSGQLSSFLVDVDTIFTASRALPQLQLALHKRFAQYKSLLRKISAAFFLISVLNSSLSVALIIMTPNQTPFVFNVRIAMFGAAGPDNLLAISQAPWAQVVSQVFAAIWWVYKSMTWNFGFFMFFTFIFILTHLLMGFNSGLDEHIRQSAGLNGESAAAYRLFYLRILDAIESGDAIFRLYLGATFLFSLIAIMFNVNALIDLGNQDLLVITILLVWIGSSFVLLGLPVVVSGRVLVLAKKPLDVLQRQEVTHKNFNELVVLLQVVSNSGGGLTCAGLFTIDYSLITTLAGLLITYLILIVQTRPGSGPAECPSGISTNSSA